MKGTQQIAQRAENAVENWVEILSDKGYNRDEAIEILGVYESNKVVKLDWAVGRYKVAHGAFLDNEVLDGALNA